MTKKDRVKQGRKLRNAIDSAGLRHDWVAKKADISRFHLSKVINGHEVLTDELNEKILNLINQQHGK